jgi:hypothetical protein
MNKLHEILEACSKNCTAQRLSSRRLVLASAGVLLAASSLDGKKKSQGGGGGDREGYAWISREDARVIGRHFHGRPGGDLPPGLAKHLRRDGHLPRGLEQMIEPFPDDVERRLPPLRRGLCRGFLDGHALVYDPRTLAILDVRVIFAH